jgi:hypothetical protein
MARKFKPTERTVADVGLWIVIEAGSGVEIVTSVMTRRLTFTTKARQTYNTVALQKLWLRMTKYLFTHILRRQNFVTNATCSDIFKLRKGILKLYEICNTINEELS